MTKTPEDLGTQMLIAVRGYVERSLSAIVTRLESFERKLAAIPQGPQGQPGESIVGPAGKDGPIGKDGIPGAPGKDGESIHPDTVRLMIAEEVGKAVAAQPKAKDGETGKDALHLEILDSIDETRSYPRGTFAKHAGGLVRALRNTGPLKDGLDKAGWDVVTEGVSAIVATQAEDAREIVVSCLLTSGTKAETRFRMPVMVYRDIYRAGVAYLKGDVVTHEGSTWHCQAAETRSAPGKSEDWKLIVKRGADGKPGKEGTPGPAGPAGQDRRYE